MNQSVLSGLHHTWINAPLLFQPAVWFVAFCCGSGFEFEKLQIVEEHILFISHVLMYTTKNVAKCQCDNGFVSHQRMLQEQWNFTERPRWGSGFWTICCEALYLMERRTEWRIPLFFKQSLISQSFWNKNFPQYFFF